jgi:outer membrane protein assembly factor BamB
MYRVSPEAAPLVVMARDHHVIALRTGDGVEQWRHKMRGVSVRIAVTSHVVVAAGTGEVVVLDYATGAVTRTIAMKGRADTLLVAGARAFVSVAGSLSCIDLDAGRELWRTDLPGTGTGAAAIGVPGATAQGDRSS